MHETQICIKSFLAQVATTQCTCSLYIMCIRGEDFEILRHFHDMINLAIS